MFKVKSEVAGVVWKIIASVGDDLDTGAAIIILESMKMEIPVPTPRAGTLKILHVAETDMILEGQEIATFLSLDEPT
ncbi:MAG TPA: acetyl-CoA carboxylase biotin carboxyl carrier protein subunit [Porticoccaceae bacterium]|nr:acetyl-CoA carboxylase biotin carboxyl carrier protein subunit [Porticoccaceae bacterium]